MAGVTPYQEIIKKLLQEYAQHPPSTGKVEMATIFDETQGHYQLVALGWQGRRRIYGCMIHIDLKGDKVWLQHDSTDAEIAQTLVEMGIPEKNIVLGFLPEEYRQHTDFAVN
jgi:muramidase (phage lysozyme)